MLECMVLAYVAVALFVSGISFGIGWYEREDQTTWCSLLLLLMCSFLVWPVTLIMFFMYTTVPMRKLSELADTTSSS